MRLRKPCIHHLYDDHNVFGAESPLPVGVCPGGEFLPEDALVIEKVEGEWPEGIVGPGSVGWYWCGSALADFLNAFTGGSKQ